MTRRLLNLLTALSLLLCVAAVAMWSLDVGRHLRISESGGVRTHGDRPGFSVTWFPYGDHSVTYDWGLPYWKLFLLLVACPVLWARRRLLPRRPLPGLCPSCGYDLRATPDRCPECGAART